MKTLTQRKKELLTANNPHIVYLVLLRKDFEVFCKIGVTSKTIEERFKREVYKPTLITAIESNGYGCRGIESIILERLTDIEDRYAPLYKLNGKTECYPITYLSKLESLFDEIIQMTNCHKKYLEEKEKYNSMFEDDIMWFDYEEVSMIQDTWKDPRK